MASWVDGPEYAPLERPIAFETPAVAPLDVAPPAISPAAGAPAEPPAYQPPSEPAPPLEALIPDRGPVREPWRPFEVVSSALTGRSAWSATHAATAVQPPPAWAPEQPLPHSPTTTITLPPPSPGFGPPPVSQAPFAQPGTPGWFAPPAPWQRVPVGPQPVTLGQMWSAATPGVILPLILGAVYAPFSVLMLAMSFLLSTRIRHRRLMVQRTFSITAAALTAIAGMALLDPDLSVDAFWELVSVWAQVACWILPVVVLLVVGAGLRAGEPPDRQF